MNNKESLEVLICFPDNYTPNANGLRVYTDFTLIATFKGEPMYNGVWEWKIEDLPSGPAVMIRKLKTSYAFSKLDNAFSKPILNALAERAMLE